ncbi:polyprenol phosphomannose-dependent alpha 1,6 mannosyltransferase MptB [Catellatospora vulcania]|uniref:polyprenol phosphomannose-dependent alpha 1,6 mannosyltransferase MptB n=1 Tax=Catellatospora vulcania TaxID=1460450 RepID=UPI0012D3FAD4|nr:polyprenol phosphomannose-dependent alpha 1,6 mannosyltransferase MptB [Catellatospora vulcania]
MLPHAATRATVALGCVSGVLLAVSAYLAGALPSGDPGPGLRLGGFGAVRGSFVLGLVCWLAGMAGWTAAWWRLGRADGMIAGRQAADPAGAAKRNGAAWRVLAIGAAWAAPLLVAPPLGSRDAYAYACQGWLWRVGLDPYAMGVADGGCPWTTSVPELWWHTPTPYGPVAVLLTGAVTGLGGLLGALAGLRLLTLAAVAVLAVALPPLARACGVPVPAAYWLALLTPLTAVHALSALHNDALVATLVITALTLAVAHRAAQDPNDLAQTGALLPASGVSSPRSAQDRRGGGGAAGAGWWGAVGAGVVVAGAVGVKVTAVVAVPFVLVLLGRRWWAAAAAGIGAFVGVSAVSGLGLGWIAALRGTGELVQWSSPPTAVGMAAGYVLRLAGRDEWVDAAVAVGRALGLVALAAAGVWALLHAWRRRHDTGAVVRACGWLMVATALLGPVFYPWYALAPLAVLAAADTDPRRRRWLAIGAVACAFLTLPNGLGVPVLTKAVGAFAVTAALIVAAVRSRPRATG